MKKIMNIALMGIAAAALIGCNKHEIDNKK